ncbi:nSTAND3 domain-containing NTPase [Mucilaginibacter polytrichastri]|uniref:Novel STAND NTPase 3 domain-containing protein n=1 Tax=Mucilaginibacter polytrichastri TaxID=1302689 RepID=A0A1Q5ZYB0_9SPHI|nr:AAA family ATPase [Mucilaginibacter polytrichastri]OKS86728.1 hypothetical protein RG47T_2185 [Mucilaginibacter polytrichastri]SFS82802.1 Adenylate kinase [Mucilaginibacter polytrichastri]
MNFNELKYCRYADIDQAANILKNANRVLVFGNAGSGKSTLARSLAIQLGMTYISMDRDIFWLPGWHLRPREEIVQRIKYAVAEPRWIMDGNSPGTLPLRLPRADLVIWRRPSRYLSLWGVFRRWLYFHGKTRPEMALDCQERLDLKFLHYIWTFERDEAPQFEAMLTEHAAQVPVLILKSYRDGKRLTDLLCGIIKAG